MNPAGIIRVSTATLLSASLIAGGAGPAAAGRGGLLVVVSASGAGEPRSGSGFSINANGRYVVFGSGASDLVPGDTNNSGDIFVRDRWTGTNSRVNLSSTGQQVPPEGDENAGAWSPATPTGSPTSSSTTCGPGPPAWSACPAPAYRAT